MLLLVSRKSEPQVRKGKAMLQIHMNSFDNMFRPYDLQGIIMPSADKAERLISICLMKAGSSGESRTHCAGDGYLGPDIAMCIPE